jgi:hypothetical protein
MKSKTEISGVRDIRLGRDIHFDAWLFSMLIDNNLAHSMNPDIIASPEQLAFMIQMDDGQVYLPCSDATFATLRDENRHNELQKGYNRAWRIIVRLIRSVIQDREERTRILCFCRYRFKQYIAWHTLIPSRLVKRMTDLILAQSLDDPWKRRRRLSSARQMELLESPEILANLEAVPPDGLPLNMRQARRMLDRIELVRLLCLSAISKELQALPPTAAGIREFMQHAEKLADALGDTFQHIGHGGTVLLLCDAEGGVVFDLFLARHLIRMGNRVIFAVKSEFYFFAPTLDDMENDPTIKPLLRDGVVLRDRRLSKKDLLHYLREHRLVVIADGTRERLNLCRVSVVFSRAWKEADVILGKGWRAADILLGTGHDFTRDIVCFWHDEQGLHMQARKRASGARKFSESDIIAQSDALIERMRNARAQSQSIMFYSCIIGSIPGETSTAVELAHTFVNYLRSKMDNIFIINPAEHFVEGMDGDDLMFMWERVQRSGLIDTWRFQTVKDIEESFAILGRKVPLAWFGKDSTYSTGCTKEMHIALDVQSMNREMQIIGPEPRLFFRRGDYGVGRYFDAGINNNNRRHALSARNSCRKTEQ